MQLGLSIATPWWIAENLADTPVPTMERLLLEIPEGLIRCK